MTRAPLVGLVTAVLLVAACALQQQRIDPEEPANVAGRTFLSVGVTDNGVARPLVAATQVRLEFRADGTLGASAGCNSMGGTYQLDGVRLRVEAGGMTAMGCDPALHEQDEWLAGFLAGTPAIAMAGDRIALSNGGVVIQLVDEEVARPDRPLRRTAWLVEGVRTRDAAWSVPLGGEASISIAEDGSVTVQTGCNTGHATATTDGDQLRFDGLALTRRACADRSVADLERAVLAVVTAPSITWSVDADRLSLDADGSGLDLRAG